MTHKRLGDHGMPGRLLLAVALLCAIAHARRSATGGVEASVAQLPGQQQPQPPQQPQQERAERVPLEQGIRPKGVAAGQRRDDVLETSATSEPVEARTSSPSPAPASSAGPPSTGPRAAATSRTFVFRNRAGSSNSVARPSSVVSDFATLCKQLCGAGIGGEHCALYCPVAVEGRELLFEAIVQRNGDAICADLCYLKLGDPLCNCTRSPNNPISDTVSVPAPMPEPASRNTVEVFTGACSSFCNRNRLTLNGCTQCQSREMPPNMYVALAPIDSNEDGKAVSATASTLTDSTPNWTELCASLCKTGDGGSLCNCDLSPFFFRWA